MTANNYIEDSLRDLLPLYYGRLFPYRQFYRWLSYGNTEKSTIFQNREFSFTLADDVYMRYQTFMNEKDMQEQIQKKNPFKIDIGAVFSSKAKDYARSQIQPVEKELVFDIDMTDYDDVRTCCQGAGICTKCWKYMAIACKVLDAALREDFGYEHLLWVFSGRRGIHCWVCDDEARRLDNKCRSAVAEYLTLLTGGDYQAKKVKLDGEEIHHSIKRAINVIRQQFVSMAVEEQDMLGSMEQVTKVLALFPEEAKMKDLEKEMKDLETSRQRWELIENHVKTLQERGLIKRWRQHLLEEIMIQYTYPRLDVNVSRGLNHLLKSPFCIHPKTGKVCTPFNPKAVDKFDPNKVPVITQLVEEINEFDRKEQEFNEKEKEKLMNTSDVPIEEETEMDSVAAKVSRDSVKRMKDYKKTSMYKSIVVFEEFVKKLEDSRKVVAEENGEDMEF